ncbi:hypothetical protein EDC01DRAFT_403198 [Geopyxis carbonaria]|nr:hypothetical protein EDC01DRAFT_403198 [Geopyxis carbonaria]
MAESRFFFILKKVCPCFSKRDKPHTPIPNNNNPSHPTVTIPLRSLSISPKTTVRSLQPDPVLRDQVSRVPSVLRPYIPKRGKAVPTRNTTKREEEHVEKAISQVSLSPIVDTAGKPEHEISNKRDEEQAKHIVAREPSSSAVDNAEEKDFAIATKRDEDEAKHTVPEEPLSSVVDNPEAQEHEMVTEREEEQAKHIVPQEPSPSAVYDTYEEDYAIATSLISKIDLVMVNIKRFRQSIASNHSHLAETEKLIKEIRDFYKSADTVFNIDNAAHGRGKVDLEGVKAAAEYFQHRWADFRIITGAPENIKKLPGKPGTTKK